MSDRNLVPAGAKAGVSQVKQMATGEFYLEATVAIRDFGAVIGAVAHGLGWKQGRVFPELQRFVATQQKRLRHNLGSRNHEMSATWQTRHHTTVICWAIHDTGSIARRELDREAMHQFGMALSAALTDAAQIQHHRPAIPHDPIIRPGDIWLGGSYSGDRRDYSRLAQPEALADLQHGFFPLGTYAFPGLAAPMLYLPERGRSAGELLRHRGILLCAPTRSGKTTLILRWAEVAIAKGFSTVIVDPKGNLFSKLGKRLRAKGIDADVYNFRTSSRGRAADSINVLEGLSCENGEGRDRIKQIALSLLPLFDKERAESESQYRRVLHRNWAVAILMILKLHEWHFPEHFADEHAEDPEVEVTRSADLADYYALVTSEAKLVSLIDAVREKEADYVTKKERCPVPSVEDQILELATALDPELIEGGRRERGGETNTTYEGLMDPLRLALAPFGPSGGLYECIRSNGTGRLFHFDMLEQPGKPVTLVLAAREHDDDKSQMILQLAMARLRHIVLDRMPDEDEDFGKPRPPDLALFLDEARRIHGFDPASFFEVSAEAGVTTVVAYQSLERISERPDDLSKTRAVMGNVGIHVYLRNVRGMDEQLLNAFLGERETRRHSHSETLGDSGLTISQGVQSERGTFFPPPALYTFPAGTYPALVVMNDDIHAPFIVDTFDPAASGEGEIS